ncbi:MAG: alpha-glucosidase [Magnetospirillum sp.]|nr:alpha-glucosidase [Magnetospirillum sp.]
MVKWAEGAVVYQVCPRSFMDGDGDGVGDLPGLIERLSYIAALGVDAVWLAPFFASPMRDFGYDVADYTAIDPLFGDIEDFDRLIAAAHRAGLKVVIDQVWAHSSDCHPWFLDSRSSRHAEKSEWYVWADAKPDGTPPNNWLSVFGGGAWTWEPRRRQYYLHHFLASQPALNWRHPEVEQALLAAGAFWRQRGVDGFRLDAVDFLLHDPALRDNPPRPLTVPPSRPFAMQQHRHDMGQPELPDLFERIRARFPGLLLVAELSSEPDPLARCTAFTGPERLSQAYTLALMKRPFTAEGIRAWIAEAEAMCPHGGLAWAFSNHDVTRVVSRWGDGSPAAARMLLALLLSLRGGICLYQGEELGLTEADLPFQALRDPFGLAFFPDFKGRDGCRTPMPWQEAAPAAGFSTAVPWLPIPDTHRPLAVERQNADPASVLHFARRMLAFRRRRTALRTGALRLIESAPTVVAFERGNADDRVLCLFNPSAARVSCVDGTDLRPWAYAFFDAASGLEIAP